VINLNNQSICWVVSTIPLYHYLQERLIRCPLQSNCSSLRTNCPSPRTNSLLSRTNCPGRRINCLDCRINCSDCRINCPGCRINCLGRRINCLDCRTNCLDCRTNCQLFHFFYLNTSKPIPVFSKSPINHLKIVPKNQILELNHPKNTKPNKVICKGQF
jgi:hypothetical protein